MSNRLLCCTGSLDGGGSERQLWQLATRIDSRAFSPQIYVHYRRGRYLELVPDRIPIHAYWPQLPSRFHWPGKIHRDQVRHLTECIRREQISLVYDRTFHMTLVTAPACRSSGCPRVSVIVSPPSKDFRQSRERFAWIKKRRLRQAYLDPHATTLAVSASVAEDAAEFYRIPRSKIEVCASPIDIEAVREAARADVFSDAYPGTHSDSYSGASQGGQVQPEMRVVVVGRLSREKGQQLAIEAFARAVGKQNRANWSMDLLGEGPERNALQRRSAELKIDERVTFHGFVNNPYPFVKRADLLVIPSEYEGFPNVALEAMVLKTPVVATDCSGALSELLGRGERGQIVPVGDIEALTRAIVDFSQASAVWRERTARAEVFVADNHGLHQWLARMQEILERQAGVADAGKERQA